MLRWSCLPVVFLIYFGDACLLCLCLLIISLISLYSTFLFWLNIILPFLCQTICRCTFLCQDQAACPDGKGFTEYIKKPSEEFSFDGFLWGILIFSFLFQRGILHEPDVLQFRYNHLHPDLQALHQFYLFLLNWNIQKFLRYDRYPLLRLKNNQCWF